MSQINDIGEINNGIFDEREEYEAKTRKEVRVKRRTVGYFGQMISIAHAHRRHIQNGHNPCKLMMSL